MAFPTVDSIARRLWGKFRYSRASLIRRGSLSYSLLVQCVKFVRIDPGLLQGCPFSSGMGKPLFADSHAENLWEIGFAHVCIDAEALSPLGGPRFALRDSGICGVVEKRRLVEGRSLWLCPGALLCHAVGVVPEEVAVESLAGEVPPGYEARSLSVGAPPKALKDVAILGKMTQDM
ncbi:hypothetical protein Nepgr_007219 [Nepenthes gracilis]|uniref:Uncharacterized protein n=1 Tax=Nepenthes gracilis TaxID=150966 RepID=A0AAD3S6S3_NEPGR|nr:hypothetical protein Nepgr_007219 [Nepenthes gracilis]